MRLSPVLPLLAAPFLLGAGEASRSIPAPVARALGAHIGNLAGLSSLPPPGPAPDFQTAPPGRLTLNSSGQLQGMYLKELGAAPRSAAEEAARAVLIQTAIEPGLARSLAASLPELPRSGQDLKTWSESLLRDPQSRQELLRELLVARQVLPSQMESQGIERAWSRLALVFEGLASQSSEGPAQTRASPARPRYQPVPASQTPGMGSLVASPHSTRPSLDNLESWFGRVDPESPSWVFRGVDRALLEDIIDHVAGDADFRALARRAAARRLAPEEERRLLGHRKYVSAFRGWLKIAEGLYAAFPSLPGLIAAYRGRGAGPQALRVILDHTTRSGEAYRVEHNPKTWQALPPQRRREIRGSLLVKREDAGVRLRLRLTTGDDLAAVARKYAAGRDPKPIEEYLKRRLRESPTGRVSIPLERLLPLFIQDQIRRHTPCLGPNCINAAMNAHRGRRYRIRYGELDQLMLMLESSFSPVPPQRPLAAGDVLVYRDKLHGTVMHASVYVGEGFVFTKNGMSRYQPYLFQSREDNERGYFRAGLFALEVFRYTREMLQSPHSP